MPRKLPKSYTLLSAVLASLLVGCTSVPAYKQQYVSKDGMTFSDSLSMTADSSLTAQIEPGSQTSGGAQASGCTACR